MELRQVESAMEGILFASGEPVPIKRLADVLEQDERTICDVAALMADRLIADGRGIRIIKLEGALQLCSSPEHADVIRKALEVRKPPQLSQTALEVLAIIAYFQPVTRAYIEQLRGVDSSYTVGSLQEKGLIEPAGKLKVPGRPTVYRTTKNFLRSFGLESVEQLPMLPEAERSGEQIELQDMIDAFAEI
jgi:segregation and condensation protein B